MRPAEHYGVLIATVLDRARASSPTSVEIINRTLEDIGIDPVSDRHEPIAKTLRWVLGRLQAGELQDYDTGLRLSGSSRQLVIPYLSSVHDYLAAHQVSDLFSRTYREIAIASFVWHEALARSSQVVETRLVDAHVVYEWPDGHLLVQLHDRRDTMDEGRAMGNCIGQYKDQVVEGEVAIYSLRKPEGGRAVSIGIWSDGSVREVKGRSNAIPVARYQPYVIEALLHLQPDRSKWGSDAEGVLRQSVGSVGFDLDPSGQLSIRPLVGSWVHDKSSGAVRGRPADRRQNLEVQSLTTRGVAPWPFPDQAVTVGRMGIDQDDFGNPIYGTKIYETRRRLVDGLPTWRLVGLYGDRTAGKRITGPMEERAMLAADGLGIPFRHDLCQRGLWGSDAKVDVMEALDESRYPAVYAMPTGVLVDLETFLSLAGLSETVWSWRGFISGQAMGAQRHDLHGVIHYALTPVVGRRGIPRLRTSLEQLGVTWSDL